MHIRFFLAIFLLMVQVYANEVKVNKHDTLEIYFDMPNLYLLKHNASLRYQAKAYLSKKKKKLKYKESIVYSSKANQEHKFKVKHYAHVEFLEEKHPFLSLVKRKDRVALFELLKQDGIKHPMKLKYVFENTRSFEDNTTAYTVLFKKKKNENWLFSLEFQYPYFLNLLHAVSFGLIGILVIVLLFRKRLIKKGKE